jgi:nucleoid-associated protein YgaU
LYPWRAPLASDAAGRKEMRMRRTIGLTLLPAALLFLGLSVAGATHVMGQQQGEAAKTPGREAAQENPPAAQPPQASRPAQAAPSPRADSPAAGEAKARKRPQSRPLQHGSTAPPKNLKLVGDHWTPYDPPDPESFPAGATLHIIVPGDTLWDLADLAFGNPYLWPQIWNENRYILDSHWIYPGDPLLLPARPTVMSEVVPQGQELAPQTAPAAAPAPPAEQAPEAAPEEAPEAPLTAEAPPAVSERPPEGPLAPRHVPMVKPHAGESDIRCSGFIAARETAPDYFIANQEDENKVGLSEGDVIYLNRGKENGHVDPGTEYSIIVRDGEVRHPVTNKKLGYYYKRLGTVRLLAAQDRTAIAMISMACDDIRTGYDLVPLLVTPQPAAPAPPFSRLLPLQEPKAQGFIVHTVDNLRRVAQGHIVDIDLGYDDGVKPGDYLTIYLPTEPYDKYRKIEYDYRWQNRRFETPPVRVDYKNEYPPKIIGQLVILMTERHTATAKIIQSLREIEVGNPIQLP